MAVIKVSFYIIFSYYLNWMDDGWRQRESFRNNKMAELIRRFSIGGSIFWIESFSWIDRIWKFWNLQGKIAFRGRNFPLTLLNQCNDAIYFLMQNFSWLFWSETWPLKASLTSYSQTKNFDSRMTPFSTKALHYPDCFSQKILL